MKSAALAPETFTGFTVNGCPPVFVRFMVCGGLDWPTVVASKLWLGGKSDAAGPLAA